MKRTSIIFKIFLFLLITNISLANASSTTSKQQTTEEENINITNGIYLYDLSNIIDNILPTVVSINTIRNETYNNNYMEENSPETISLGSGFLISEDGYIITNYHVIKDGKKINIKLKGSETNFPAEIIGVDEIMDVALLKISIKNKLPYVEFDKTNNYKVGDIVIVAGNPYNLGVSVSTGIISALNRNLKMTSFDNFIQTDASINKGNSGGPMFNLRGKVIGLTSAIYSPDGSNVGIGFAMPTTDLLPLIEELKRYGYVKRGTIGITVENVQKEIFDVLDINNRRYGVIIVNVKTDSSAEKAGLLVSDIILKYNGKRVRNSRDLSLLITSTAIDSKVNLEVLRNNKIINISVKIEENKENYKYDPEYEALLSKAVEIFDAVLIPINKTAKKRFDIQENKGMYVLKTKKGGLADKKGIRTGDIILSINQDQAVDGDIILQNIHNAELNRSKYVFIIVKSMNKNNLIFMPISNNTSSKITID